MKYESRAFAGMLVLAAAMAASLCHAGEPAATAVQSPAAEAQAPAPASGIEAQVQICAACHGPNGNSATPEWPTIAGQLPGYMADQLELLRSTARNDPTMSPMAKTLSDADITALSQHFSKQALTSKPAPGKDPAAGKVIFESGRATPTTQACKDCHGADGRGNADLAAPALRGQQPVYTVKQLQAYAMGTRYQPKDDGTPRTSPNGAMEAAAKGLTPDDMQSVGAYLATLP